MNPRREVPGCRLFLVVLTTLLVVTFAADTGQALEVRGRAYGIYVNTPSLGVVQTFYCDTGWLPSDGGNLVQSTTNFAVQGVVTASSITATSDGDECEGDSDVIVNDMVILPNHPGVITFSTLAGRDDDECCDIDGDSPEAAIFTNLTFAGQPVTVTGAMDQKVTIAGVGTLTINEVVRDDDDDCDDDDFVVNALHLVLENGEEVIIGSTFFESDDECCAIPTENVTWGAIKGIYELD